jgi:hypothetical protein
LATLHKRVKGLKRHFPNLIKTLIYKRPPKLLFNNKSLKFSGGFVKHHNIYTKTLNTLEMFGKLEK